MQSRFQCGAEKRRVSELSVRVVGMGDTLHRPRGPPRPFLSNAKPLSPHLPPSVAARPTARRAIVSPSTRRVREKSDRCDRKLARMRIAFFRRFIDRTCMGQQHRARAKRKKRRAYLQRKKAALRASTVRPAQAKQRPKKEPESTE